MGRDRNVGRQDFMNGSRPKRGSPRFMNGSLTQVELSVLWLRLIHSKAMVFLFLRSRFFSRNNNCLRFRFKKKVSGRNFYYPSLDVKLQTNIQYQARSQNSAMGRGVVRSPQPPEAYRGLVAKPSTSAAVGMRSGDGAPSSRKFCIFLAKIT